MSRPLPPWAPELQANARNLLAFCRSVPPRETYDYADTRTCPLTRFGRSLGYTDPRAGGDYVYDRGVEGTRLDLPFVVRVALRGSPASYGELVNRLGAGL